MKHKLISVALITILLFMVLGNSIACTSTTTYTLTMSSTAGGSVTPAVGAHNYSAGTAVNLTATPDGGYRFVNWTGGGADIANANAATTTITMNADHTVTAHFALGTLIENVPDANQPPTVTLVTTIPTNFCAPMAVANILEYWDDVANNASAQNVTAGLPPETVAEYVGYFMDTNNTGSPLRANPGLPGTYNVDVLPGIVEFVRWDNGHPFPPAPPPALPAGKLGYNWGVVCTCDTDYTITLDFYKNEINHGRPLVVSFDYWNPVDKDIAVIDPETGETISVFVWGDPIPGSLPGNPEEYWTYGDIGHAVTGVGYILNWDPAGPAPLADYVIVHDNWATTPENVAIPWANWMCLWQVIPGP
jgi:hypothetical protein